MKFLREWTVEDVRAAIETDYPVDLSFIVSSMQDKIVDEVLGWFLRYRPDLYSALSSKEGRAWMKRNLNASF